MWPFKKKPKPPTHDPSLKMVRSSNADDRAEQLRAEGYEERPSIMIEGKETRVFVRDPAKLEIKE